MIDAARKWIQRLAESFKRQFYGRTFFCPVCHVELAIIDVNGNRLLVCPVCGVVLDVEEVYGHVVPVVLDLELHRPQPKLRMHPLSTHIPIGLYPFALLGALALLAFSLCGSLPMLEPLRAHAPLIAEATLVLLVLSVGFSLLTFVSGLRDWFRRYRRRPYAQIRVKIAFSAIFLALGGLAIALHASGAAFSATTGLVDLTSPLAIVLAVSEVAILSLGMVVMATLGHIGGTLVFGR